VLQRNFAYLIAMSIIQNIEVIGIRQVFKLKFRNALFEEGEYDSPSGENMGPSYEMSPYKTESFNDHDSITPYVVLFFTLTYHP